MTPQPVTQQLKRNDWIRRDFGFTGMSLTHPQTGIFGVIKDGFTGILARPDQMFE
jgi:hypothetical protein